MFVLTPMKIFGRQQFPKMLFLVIACLALLVRPCVADLAVVQGSIQTNILVSDGNAIYASFSPTSQVSGPMVIAYPSDGCSLSSSTSNYNGRVILLSWSLNSNCTILSVAMRAALAGALAVVNYIPGGAAQQLTRVASDGSAVSPDIVVVSVSGDTGALLATYVNSGLMVK